MPKPAKPAAKQPAAPKKNGNLTKAMKLVASGASGFKIVGFARKLDPADEVAVYEALAARPSPPHEASDLLAKAYARAGRFAEAVRAARDPHTLLGVGEAALDGGAFTDAEAAFSAVEPRTASALVGLAIAQKKSGKDPTAALARAAKANVPKKPIDWASATSCYDHAGVAITKAMILAVGGDLAAAKESLSEARVAFQKVAQKGVRKECDDQLAAPADPQWWASTLARHAGLG